MKVYVGVGSNGKPCSGLYSSKEECEATLNNATYGGVNDGRIKVVELVTLDETEERDKEVYNQAVRNVLNGLNADGFFCGNEVEDYLLERYLR